MWRRGAAGSATSARPAALDPSPTFFALLDAYLTGEVRGPLNLPDRRRAGFDEEELDLLAWRAGDRTGGDGACL